MALKVIPTVFTAPDFSFTIDLDRIVYLFRFVLNERTNRWSMSISTEAGDPIVMGVPVVANWGLLNRFKDSRLPPGNLFTCDITGGNTEPDETSFGDTVLLMYNEALSS